MVADVLNLFFIGREFCLVLPLTKSVECHIRVKIGQPSIASHFVCIGVGAWSLFLIFFPVALIICAIAIVAGSITLLDKGWKLIFRERTFACIRTNVVSIILNASAIKNLIVLKPSFE